MSKPHSCAWCESEVGCDEGGKPSWFCPECHETYEAETKRSLHPAEERRPHND